MTNPIANGIDALFTSSTWESKMNDAFERGVYDSNAFENDTIWQDIKTTVNAFMAQAMAGGHVSSFTITLASIATTCDGGCLEAAFVVSWNDNTGLWAHPINLMSAY